MGYIQFMENNDMEKLGKVLPLEGSEKELNDRDNSETERMNEFVRLRRVLKNEEDFARQSSLKEQIEILAKKLDIDPNMEVSESEMDMAA